MLISEPDFREKISNLHLERKILLDGYNFLRSLNFKDGGSITDRFCAYTLYLNKLQEEKRAIEIYEKAIKNRRYEKMSRQITLELEDAEENFKAMSKEK